MLSRATVIGHTPDEVWLLLDFNNLEMRVAAFLGEVYGEGIAPGAVRSVPD